MSVLRDRIVGHQTEPADYHPVGTAQTPMVMPAGIVSYNELGALYQTVHPIITADGAVIPGVPFHWPTSVPNVKVTEDYAG